ncbi:MAG: type II toxin-antitoxin system prevent-host-death family antitoxin [Candidatus Dormiibacterota bacterium]|jgi:prevent-host-death family protein
MIRIGVRELRQHASRYLERVRSGETVEVTDRGTLVALLVPPGPSEVLRDHLLTSGRLIPAQAPFTLPRRHALPGGTPSASEVLSELRTERLP